MKDIKSQGSKGQDKVVKDLLKAVFDIKPVVPERIEVPKQESDRGESEEEKSIVAMARIARELPAWTVAMFYKVNQLVVEEDEELD